MNESNIAQARVFLDCLWAEAELLVGLIEAEQTLHGGPLSIRCRRLRAELYEVYKHIDQLRRHFPEAAQPSGNRAANRER